MNSQSISSPKISIVVISYNMGRELPRTLYSLSPMMQVGVSGDEYEVIVVDNGSTEHLDIEALQLWDGVRVHEMENPTVSPAQAVNVGLSLARGDYCGVMVDGARMVSPGLVANTLKAFRLGERSIVATLGFHLGPDFQPLSVKHGYNKEVEDRLLEGVAWKEDGYRLFSISVFAGSSRNGWFEPFAESNALFMAKDLWRELDGCDERFMLPGGGLVNLDLFARACILPNIELLVLLGEGTFHQVHGGIATNDPEYDWQTMQDEYRKIRGENFSCPVITPYYFGKVNNEVKASLFNSTSE